jgi:hypothetical protein
MSTLSAGQALLVLLLLLLIARSVVVVVVVAQISAFPGKNGGSLLFVITITIVIIYLTRSAYDFTTTSGVGTLLVNTHHFAIVGLYILWEILPVSLVLFMFRVCVLATNQPTNHTRHARSLL